MREVSEDSRLGASAAITTTPSSLSRFPSIFPSHGLTESSPAHLVSSDRNLSPSFHPYPKEGRGLETERNVNDPVGERGIGKGTEYRTVAGGGVEGRPQDLS